MTVDEAGAARVWTLPEGWCVARLSGHGAAATDIATTPCGKAAASVGRDGRIRVWSLEWELGPAAPLARLPDDARALLRRAAEEGVARAYTRD